MAMSLLIARRLVWLLLIGMILVALSGCTQRDETNPFIGPYGASSQQPFG
jgi:hypothetical protein